MSAPLYNPNIVGQGLAWLTGAFQQQPNIRAWLAALLSEVQHLEDAFWGTDPNHYGLGILTARFLATAPQYALPQTNIAFDVIGELVGQPRGGMSDSQYVTAIYLRIATNASEGRAIDWARIAQILLRAGAGGPVSYTDASYASIGATFYLFVGDMAAFPDPNTAAQIVGAGVTSGVRGILGYSTWPDGNDFCFADWNSPTTSGQGGFGDAIAGKVGGQLVSCEELS